MSDELRKQIERLRAKLREAFGSSPSGFKAVLVEGGLTPLPAIASDDIGGEWIRDVAAGETVEDFAQRAAHASRESGAKICAIGGMPSSTASETLRAAAKATSDHYYEYEYPEVPPCEGQGFERRSSPYMGGR